MNGNQDIRPRRCVTADEVDVHTRWRHVQTALGRPGVAKATKTRSNRRERREGQVETRNWTAAY